MDSRKQPTLSYEQVANLRDEGLLRAMQGLGLSGQKQLFNDRWIISANLNHLFLLPTAISLFASENGPLSGCSFGVDVAVQDPRGNEGRISCLASDFGMGHFSTASELLDDLARKWVQGTLPSVCRLFDTQCGEIAGHLKLESYTEGDAQFTIWEGFVGKVQFYGDEMLRQRVADATPYRLANQAIANYLQEKRLHWGSIHGVRYSNGSTEIRIEIDNQFDEQVSAAASQQFDWSGVQRESAFSQFFVMRPYDSKPLAATSDKMAEAMREHDINTTRG